MAAFTQRQTTPKKKDFGQRGSIRKFESSDEDNSSDQSDSDDEQSWKRRKTAPALDVTHRMTFDEPPSHRDQQRKEKSFERRDYRPSRMKDGGGVGAVGGRRKNNIWGSVALEQNQEAVEREITHFGVDQVMERDVETYSYKDTEQLPLGVATNIPPGDDDVKGRRLVMAVGEDEDDAWLADDSPRHSEEEEELHVNRPHDDLREKLKKRGSMVADRFRRSNVKSRLGTHSDDTEQAIVMKKVDIDPSAEKKVIAGQLAFSLQEPKRDLVLRIVKILGVEKALEIWRQTEEIENDGGMMIANRSRRRSPGGVFIQLMKTDPDISKETIKDIFSEEKKAFEAERKKRRRHTRKSAASNKEGRDHQGNKEEEMEDAEGEGCEGDEEAIGEMDMKDDGDRRVNDEPCVNEMELMPDDINKPSNIDHLESQVPLPQQECRDITEDNDSMMFPKLGDVPKRNEDSDPEDGEVLDDDDEDD